MDRRVLIAAVALALGVGLAWKLGYLGPQVGGVEEGPVADGDAPSLLGAPGDAAGTGPEAVALARGGSKPVAKTKAPAVDGPRITGHVTNRDGKPVPDAHVISIPDSTTSTFGPGDLGSPTCPAFDAVTDEKGAFVVAVSKDAPMHAIVVEAASYGSTIEGGVRAGADLTIVLDKSASIYGTVTGAEGAPLVGARVRVIGSLDAYRVDLEAIAGVGGAYRIEGVPATNVKRKLGASLYSATLVSVVEVTADAFVRF